MPLHLRRQKQVVVLTYEPKTTIPELRAELAEILVSTKEATYEQVSDLRIGLNSEDISESTKSLSNLNIANDTTLVFKFGDEMWEFEEFTSG